MVQLSGSIATEKVSVDQSEHADGEDDEWEKREEDVVGDSRGHLRAVVIAEPEDRVLDQQPEAPKRQHLLSL